MAGSDDHSVAMMGEWMRMSSSPRAFLSSLVSKELGSRPFADQLDNPDGHDGMILEHMKHEMVMGSQHNNNAWAIDPLPGDLSLGSRVLVAQMPCSRGSLSDEVAERAGFGSVPCTDAAVARLRPAELLLHSEVPSPLMHITGCPTDLLNSPMFPADPAGQASPKIGKYQWEQHSMDLDLASLIEMSYKNKDQLPGDEAPDLFSFAPRLRASSAAIAVERGDAENAKKHANGLTFDVKKLGLATANERSPSLDDHLDNKTDLKGELYCAPIDDEAADGYNWRKYGQKHLKGSEYLRSYYKCTQPNCKVKKKVECSHEGHVIEIIYKGAHNHPKPLVNASEIPASHEIKEFKIDGFECRGAQANGNWRSDDLEASSACLNFSFYGPSRRQGCGLFGSPHARGVSSIQSNKGGLHTEIFGSLHCGWADVDENEPKRRKLDACANEISSAARTACEARIVLQTVSVIDVLDDGYHWRKYGQKVIKGNPNPRSYYKCTHPGCVVRKHIERSSKDLNSVLTTYEGKHNHEVPTSRNNKEAASGLSNFMLYPNGFQGRLGSAFWMSDGVLFPDAAAATPWLGGFVEK